jgi:hypothetical protein
MINYPDNTVVTSLPPIYVQNIAVDGRGFVRVGGVCVGRLIQEADEVYFEVKDRNNARSLSRGAQMIRVPTSAVVKALAE